MKQAILIASAVILFFWNHDAAAFWGSDSSNAASGLNVSSGFDVNTITTLTGTVMTQPERKGSEQHTLMTVDTPQGSVTAVLGPWWYWEKQTITITEKQTLAITGSLAQGKDGGRYIFVQKIENRSNGESVTLRSESGTPFWSGSGSGKHNGARQNNGSGPRSGAGNRGGAMRGGRR